MRVVLFDFYTDGHHAEYACHVLKYLLECDDDVTFATSPQGSALDCFQELTPALRIRSIPASPRGSSQMPRARRLLQVYHDLRWCRRLAQSQRADVLHHLYLDGSEFAWLAASRTTKASLTFATLFGPHEGRRARRRSGAGVSFTSMAKRSALKYEIEHGIFDGVFVDSPRSRNVLLDALGPHVPDQTVTAVPNPAPSPRFVTKRDARARLNLPPDQPSLLFFGGLRREKGPDIFLRALASVPGNWIAVIAGEPQSVSDREVRELVAGLTNPAQVVLRLNAIPDADLDDYFAAADAVVLPYRRSFGRTSGVLMRAAAAGCPVVAFDVDDIGSIVSKHELGILVAAESTEALATALTSYLSDRDQINRAVSPRALAYARENGVAAMGAAIRATYLRHLRANAGAAGPPADALVGHV